MLMPEKVVGAEARGGGVRGVPRGILRGRGGATPGWRAGIRREPLRSHPFFLVLISFRVLVFCFVHLHEYVRYTCGSDHTSGPGGGFGWAGGWHRLEKEEK